MLDKVFSPEKVEDKHYKSWEESGAFSSTIEGNRSPFCIMMPPPNVTGSLHMGHALNMTLQDILTRYNRMKSKNTLWQPGTDHAGIATQMVVERMLDTEGTSRKALGREAFVDKVWEWKEESGGTISKQLRRLGTTPDWSRERFTMDEGLSKAVKKVFVQLYNEGLIYRDKRLVNWDPKLHTAISDLEVESRESKGHMWHINYPLQGDTERFITVATTRPETMLGDTAIAVHPDDERYKDLIGKFAILPIVGRPLKIVADEYADPEQGSGAVKITPAHDFNDFEVGKRHDLEMLNIFDINACLNDKVPDGYVGLDRYDARKKVLKELEELDLIVDVEKIKHMVPYGDRSGVIVEPFLTEQWYVDAETLAKPAIEAVRSGKTEFVPKQWENTYFHWMENIQPWCISRQLWWGHQIPAWYGYDGEVFIAESEDEAYEQARAHYGNDDVKLTQDEDVLDTWFSSALWPFSTLGWPEKTKELEEFYPGDVLITGFDIIFFWVARMMMMGLHFMDGEVPFRKVYIHALVRDAKGQKMSKSRGNIIDPLDLIDQFGSDALRFTLTAMAGQGRDIKLSEEKVQGYRNFGTKLWNAAKYCELNECKPDKDFDPASVNQVLNEWIISSVAETSDEIEKAIDTYRFNEAAHAIYQFIWNSFCDWYLEFTKPILTGDDIAEDIISETRQTTGWVLEQIITMLNPIMPFITEELNEVFFGNKEALINSEWPDYGWVKSFSRASEEIEWLIKFISEIRSVRSDMNVPAKAMINLLVKDAAASTRTWIDTYADIIKTMARLDNIDILDGAIPSGSIQTVVKEATLVLPIADIIDLDKERARLEKEISKLDISINQINKKLENEKFVANAPAEVVEEQKNRKADAELVREKLCSALKQLEAA
jgi:valyl-tRNA synthetase